MLLLLVTFVNDIQSATAREMFKDIEIEFLLSACLRDPHADSMILSCNILRLVPDRFATIIRSFQALVDLIAKLLINYILHVTYLVII